MKQCMEDGDLHRRLRRIAGQVQAIERMLGEDVPCEDVLSQIHAAKSALNMCGSIIMQTHIRNCIRDGLPCGDADKITASFVKAVERFADMN